MLSPFFLLFIFIVAGAITAFIIVRLMPAKTPAQDRLVHEANTARQVAEQMLLQANADKQQLQQQLADIQQQLQQAYTDTASLKAALSYKEEKLNTQKQEIEQIGERFEGQFKILAANILDEKARSFTAQQDVQLKNILDPLKQNILGFKQEFESRYNEETRERISLREQIRYMMDLNKTLSEQANNLTTALRGQVKQQGNWGEMILESILEHTGLQKNVQYFVQHTTTNLDGKTIQPDVVVKYPDNRSIVIDSKVSLVHYERYCNAATPVEQQECLRFMIQSLKAHIDGLSAKSYNDVTDALDFVLMFIPVEAAYIVAMQGDTALWQYAYSRKILLLSPTNLIAAMKLVNDMWQRDAVNRDAQKIADKAGKLYDKLVGFVENFERVGAQIGKAQMVWDDAYKQLSKGKGNLISQGEQMKRYKASTGKSLPALLVEEAMIENGQEEDMSGIENPA